MLQFVTDPSLLNVSVALPIIERTSMSLSGIKQWRLLTATLWPTVDRILLKFPIMFYHCALFLWLHHKPVLISIFNVMFLCILQREMRFYLNEEVCCCPHQLKISCHVCIWLINFKSGFSLGRNPNHCQICCVLSLSFPSCIYSLIREFKNGNEKWF